MKTARVTVLPYNAAWANEFERIRCEILAATDGLAIGVEHVGSTSVVGMWAKPCIDLDVVIADRGVLPEIVEKLRLIGYIHEGDLGIEGREAFCYSGKEHLMTHHLYVCTVDSPELRRHLTFRDFLGQNPQAAEKYSRTKRRAAELFPDDIDGYIGYKAPCIAELYRECGLA